MHVAKVSRRIGVKNSIAQLENIERRYRADLDGALKEIRGLVLLGIYHLREGKEGSSAVRLILMTVGTGEHQGKIVARVVPMGRGSMNEMPVRSFLETYQFFRSETCF